MKNGDPVNYDVIEKECKSSIIRVATF